MDWKILVSGLVLLLAASSCESAAVSAVSADLPELCPCLSINLCPRIYGASADDRKYLGEFMKCTKEGEVRCCGASISLLTNPKEAEEDQNKSGSSEEKTSHLDSNEIEDVRMEHLTIPPPVTTEASQPEIPTTTELIETTTFTTEEPLETTTSNVEEDLTTTEPPPPEVTPRFGKGVEFIYAMTPVELERESKRRGKKLSFEEENVFIIMSQRFLEEEAANEIAQQEVTPLTTTTTTDQPEAEIITTTVEGRFADEEASITTTEIPELPTTMITTTTTRRPRIRKKIRVKVRKGFKLFPRVTNGSTELNLEDTETTTKENTRKNRDLEDNPKAKINHALYARRRHLLDMKSNITKTTQAPDQEKSTADEVMPITTVPSIAEPSNETTESSTPSSSAQQNPALLNIFTKNAAKRRNFYNRRLLKNEAKAEQTHAQEEKQIPKPVAVIKVTKDEANNIEGQHRKVIEQVMAAVQQSGLKTTFDLADEIMDPEMAVRIANIQKMLTQEIMKTILAKMRVKAVEAQSKETLTATSTTMATTAAVETENPINAAESKSAPVHPYRGSKRYIDTNFLNAYENVIHKVEEKIKTHKTRSRPTNPPKSGATESPENVQHLLNNRRRTRVSTTTASPAITERAPSVGETVTQLIEELEKIQELEAAPKKFKPSQLWQVIRESPPTSEQRRQDTDELSAPIDLLAKDNGDSNGFVPIPARAGSSLAVGPAAARQHLRRSA